MPFAAQCLHPLEFLPSTDSSCCAACPFSVPCIGRAPVMRSPNGTDVNISFVCKRKGVVMDMKFKVLLAEAKRTSAVLEYYRGVPQLCECKLLLDEAVEEVEKSENRVLLEELVHNCDAKYKDALHQAILAI